VNRAVRLARPRQFVPLDSHGLAREVATRYGHEGAAMVTALGKREAEVGGSDTYWGRVE
jgi:hypothetical protein